MTITGQSGAAMLLPARDQRMSDAARRIVRCAAHLLMFMQSPEKSAWYDAHVFEVDTLLRGYAMDYIDQACQDLDAVHARSRARATDLAASHARIRALAPFLQFSTMLDGGGFCQAGVVAPPDSLMHEITPSFSSGAAF